MAGFDTAIDPRPATDHPDGAVRTLVRAFAVPQRVPTPPPEDDRGEPVDDLPPIVEPVREGQDEPAEPVAPSHSTLSAALRSPLRPAATMPASGVAAADPAPSPSPSLSAAASTQTSPRIIGGAAKLAAARRWPRAVAPPAALFVI